MDKLITPEEVDEMKRDLKKETVSDFEKCWRIS